MKSWNEIRKAATAFSKRWKNAYDEKALSACRFLAVQIPCILLVLPSFAWRTMVISLSLVMLWYALGRQQSHSGSIASVKSLRRAIDEAARLGVEGEPDQPDGASVGEVIISTAR